MDQAVNAWMDGPISYFSFLMRNRPVNKRMFGVPEDSVTNMERELMKNWKKLEYMIFCSTDIDCLNNYEDELVLGGKTFRMNLIQSLSLLIGSMKELTDKLKMTEKY